MKNEDIKGVYSSLIAADITLSRLYRNSLWHVPPHPCHDEEKRKEGAIFLKVFERK